jgi:phytanoyl-CoA hydroxylase
VLDDILRLFERRLGASAQGRRGVELVASAYEQDKAAWQQCAKRMCHSLVVARLASKPELIGTLRKAGLSDPMFSTVPELRIDMPEDARYMQPWHQDWRSGQGSLNAVTFWLPLHDVAPDQGAVELLPGSHRWGMLPTEELHNPVRLAIKDLRIDGASGPVAALAAGECAFFSQMLVHRSGWNRTRKPRFTCQLRYTDRADPHFIANGFRMPIGHELVWNPPPDEAAMDAIYGR